MRDITQRLLDALESEHELAENWRETHRTEAPTRGITTLIAEARAALAAQAVRDDEWLAKCHSLIGEYRRALFDMADTESQAFTTAPDVAHKAGNALFSHLRTRPAPEGVVLVPVEPSDAMIDAARAKWQARVKERVESGSMSAPLPSAQTRALVENYKAMIAAAQEGAKS
jgi:hypothetical protein